jgi:hypothetical protein
MSHLIQKFIIRILVFDLVNDPKNSSYIITFILIFYIFQDWQISKLFIYHLQLSFFKLNSAYFLVFCHYFSIWCILSTDANMSSTFAYFISAHFFTSIMKSVHKSLSFSNFLKRNVMGFSTLNFSLVLMIKDGTSQNYLKKT